MELDALKSLLVTQYAGQFKDDKINGSQTHDGEEHDGRQEIVLTTAEQERLY